MADAKSSAGGLATAPWDEDEAAIQEGTLAPASRSSLLNFPFPALYRMPVLNSGQHGY